MMRTYKIVGASAIALGAALLASGPASAQEACEVNGTSTVSGTATGVGSLACGAGSTADNGNVAVGANSSATGGGHSTAIGSYATADTDPLLVFGDATAVGSYAAATGDNSTAVGAHANATGDNSTAVGAFSSDGGFDNSVAIGTYTTNTANNQVAIGNRTLTQLAAGTIAAGSTDAVNGDQVNTILVNQAATDTTQDAALATAIGNQAVVDTAQDAALTGFIINQNLRDNAQEADILALEAESAYIAINSTGAPAVATGVDAIAIGEGATAGFANSVAIGAGTVNTAANQVAVGGQTAGTARVVTGVANGAVTATSWDAVNGQQLFATNNRVTAIETLNTTQANQIAALQTQDVVLGGRIDSLSLSVDRRFDRMDDYVAGSTAVASALSGAAFLPDRAFNMTANVATYDGAYAGALQVGALIGPNAAINAGVASGFNKRGKTAVRAGVTYGW